MKFMENCDDQLSLFKRNMQISSGIDHNGLRKSYVKERIAKQGPTDKFNLRIIATQALERLQAMSQTVRGFFAHPECGFVN